MYSTGWRRVYSSVWPFNLPLYAHSRLKYALKNKVKVFVVYVSRPAGRGEQTQTPNKNRALPIAHWMRLIIILAQEQHRICLELDGYIKAKMMENTGLLCAPIIGLNGGCMHAQTTRLIWTWSWECFKGRIRWRSTVCLPVCLFCFVFAHTELLILTVAKATEERETEYHFDWTRTHTGRHHEIAGRAKLWPIYHLFPQAWYRTRGLLARSCHLLDISNRSGAGGSGQSLACARHRTGRLSTTNCTRLPPFLPIQWMLPPMIIIEYEEATVIVGRKSWSP